MAAVTTQGELQDCAARNRIGLKKANADKARIRELVLPEKKHFWKRWFK